MSLCPDRTVSHPTARSAFQLHLCGIELRRCWCPPNVGPDTRSGRRVFGTSAVQPHCSLQSDTSDCAECAYWRQEYDQSRAGKGGGDTFSRRRNPATYRYYTESQADIPSSDSGGQWNGANCWKAC
jgi:hypothetical protein